MPAAGRIVARSDEAVRRCGCAGAQTSRRIHGFCEFAPCDRYLAVPSPYDRTYSQTTDKPGRTTGNVPMARLTQPHTRLKCLRVRSSYLPWNQPRGARSAAVGESAGIDRRLGGHSLAAA
jgi:hypothetical protein